MKRLFVLASAILLASSIGCGSQGVDPSAAAPAPTPEDTTSEIEEAMGSGEIDPSSYGKQ